MERRWKIAAGAALALALAVAVGASGAIAVSRALDGDGNQAVIEDAAEQLGVEPQALSDALEQALKNRVDEAVESGRLTEGQGERLKERIDQGLGPFFGGLGHRGFGKGFGSMRGWPALDAAASYLGLGETELRERLREGKTLADVARDEGKSVDGLVRALVEGAEKRIDDAVAAGRVSEERAARMKEGIEARMTELVNGELRPRGWPFGRGSRFDGPRHTQRAPGA